MVILRRFASLIVLMVCCLGGAAFAQSVGSIRGAVYDKDFDVPIADAKIFVVETQQTVTTGDDGNYVIPELAAGEYTLVVAKEGYAQQIRATSVADGELRTEDVYLTGEFTDLDELVVEDLQIGGGTEASLLQLRLDSPALIDSISAELMSRAGASDAAGALSLIAGATVQDGKFAVIRGLPDRYVNSQINGIRLPTADADKRAVQLDQFPSAIIQDIRISKTFTPDQQGDASGGAVNVILKGVPTETFVSFKFETSYNSQASNNSKFLTYVGGGVNTLGDEDGSRAPQLDRLGENWNGAAGASRTEAPVDFKWSIAAGGRHDLGNGITVGAFGSLFYERDSSFFDNGIDDSYWVTTPGEGLVPQTFQGVPDPSGGGDFKTGLFDVTEGTQLVQWGGLGALGVETENHSVGFNYLYTRIAEDTATLAEDTRGKAYFFPGYDPDDPFGEGNEPGNLGTAPYIRTQTLEYTERTTETVQLTGSHRLPFGRAFGIENVLRFLEAELAWSVSRSTATLYQPDKRQFGAIWVPESFNPGFPPFVPPFFSPPEYRGYKPAEVFTLGNFQRIFKDIEERSEQYAIDLTLPFEQWSGQRGYFKFGIFDDEVKRSFNQDTFSNFNDNPTYEGDFDEFWTDVFPFEDHPISDGPPYVDVDYRGNQTISAGYAMVDIPFSSVVKVIGGARYEDTTIGIVNIPEENATWFPPDAVTPVALQPGDADVTFDQTDWLPSVGLVITPTPQITLRGSYAETVARQTFKELTPIQQQEFLGGDVFIGNPELQQSSLKNYDLRFDYAPAEGVLFSASYFKKDITDPIEIVQRVVSAFSFDTPVNYPSGEISGFELEVRQNLGQYWDRLEGIAIGANATFIDSEVILPADEAADFAGEAIQVPITSRDATNAPEHLYNFYVTADSKATGTQVSLFYTVRGDTLVAGAGQNDGNFIPSVYETEFDTLNLAVTQKLGEHFKIVFKAKNLTDPRIDEVFRSSAIGSDVLKTSFTRGIDYSIGISAEFNF